MDYFDLPMITIFAAFINITSQDKLVPVIA